MNARVTSSAVAYLNPNDEQSKKQGKGFTKERDGDTSKQAGDAAGADLPKDTRVDATIALDDRSLGVFLISRDGRWSITSEDGLRARRAGEVVEC